MIFSFLSHFAVVYFRTPAAEPLRATLVRIGMVATPAFLMFSGMVVGLLAKQARSSMTQLRLKLVDRGLFLLLISHALIWMAVGPGDPRTNTTYSTDAIGFATIVGVLVVPALNKRTRLLIGAGLYTGSWLAIYFWHPATWMGEATKELTVGSLDWLVWPPSTTALLPWTAVYIAASAVGERIFDLYRDSRPLRATLECVAISSTALLALVFTKLGALWLRQSPLLGHVASPLLRIGQKSPPGPLYLALYGAVGLMMLAWWMDRFGRGEHGVIGRIATLLGESSLFVYVAHFYLFCDVVYAFGPGGLWDGLIWFIGSVALLVWAAAYWRRSRCNRYLTVRLDWVWQRLQRDADLQSEMVPAQSR